MISNQITPTSTPKPAISTHTPKVNRGLINRASGFAVRLRWAGGPTLLGGLYLTTLSQEHRRPPASRPGAAFYRLVVRDTAFILTAHGHHRPLTPLTVCSGGRGGI